MLGTGPVVVGHDDHLSARQVTGVMGLKVLGPHRAGRRGQPEALHAVLGILLALDPDDQLVAQGRLHNVCQVVEDGPDAVETVDVAAIVVRSGLQEILVFPAAVEVVASAVGVMNLSLRR